MNGYIGRAYNFILYIENGIFEMEIFSEGVIIASTIACETSEYYNIYNEYCRVGYYTNSKDYYSIFNDTILNTVLNNVNHMYLFKRQ